MNKPQLLKWKIAASQAGLALLVFASSASAQVLLNDTWVAGPQGNSENPNQNLAARQTGTQILDPYNGYGSQTQIGNTGTDVGTNAAVAAGNYCLLAFNSSIQSQLDVASAAAGPLIIDFDMFFHNGSNPGGDGNSSDWGAFTLEPNANPFPVVGGGQFGFLTRLNGGIQVFQNGGSLSSVSSWNAAGFALQDHWKLIFTDTNGTGSAFVGNGSQVTMINGGTVSGGGTTLGTIPLSQLNANGLYPGWTQTGSMFIGVANVNIQVSPAIVTQNLSFEQYVAPRGSSAPVVPAGWLPFNKAGGGDIGSENAGGTDYTLYDPLYTPAQGNQFCYINNFVVGATNGIYQDMGPLLPNHTYNLTVAIGSRADRVNSPGIISLVNGTNYTGTVLASTSGIPATQNTWQDYTVTYTTGPSVSGDLTIMLSVIGDGNIQADFDNVRLDNPTPPPATPILVQDILPTSVVTYAGDQVIFSASYSNSPAITSQWQQVVGGVTNNINTGVVNVTNNGVVTSTLTLNSVLTTASGTYWLEAIDSTNNTAIKYSTGAPLTVSSLPAPVNNVVIGISGQTGLGAISPVNASTNFYPVWVENTNNDLIYGSVDGGPNVPGTVYAGGGNFAVNTPGPSDCNGDPVILSDGNPGYQNYYPNVGGNQTMDTLGVNPAGVSVTYTLPSSSSTGWSLTNITVYGGWGDGGRDEQKYQVLYSTISAPTVFNNLVSVDYLPSNPNNLPSATRTTLVPASGVMAQNVYAIEFNFNNAGSPPENSWEGYSEIVVAGQPSPPVPVLLTDIAPTAAEDVVGGSLTLTAGFSGATSYQWLKNGTNLVGQTSPTLTLTNLHLTDVATNGGYRLLAINGSGTNTSSSCTVYVDPAPTPVGNIITSVAYQTDPAGGFGPTWNTSSLGSSLIYNQNPPMIGYDPTGNFNDPDPNPLSNGQAGGLPVLTDGNYGIFNNAGPHPAFATCGDSAGEYVIYQLGNNSPAANGYDITNIQIAGGWNDNGRDSQYYTVMYSTAANPTMFYPMVAVANNLSSGNALGGGTGGAVPSGSGIQTTVRTTFQPVSGVLASNVNAIFVDYQYPSGVPNGYSGYSEISVFGTPSANPPPTTGPVITTANQQTNITWTTPESPNLIAGQLPSSYAPAALGLTFTNGEGCTASGFTDGILSVGGNANSGMGGTDTNNAYQYIVYSPTNGGSWNLTNIVTYSLWHDYGRDGQFYVVSYATTSNPTLFLPLATVAFNPFAVHNGTASGNRVQIAPPVGQTLLASNVAAVKFDFTSQGSQDYNWSGYTEIILQGTNLPPTVVAPPTLPTAFARPTVSGGNLILTGTGGSPAGHAYIWLSTTNLSAPITWTTNITGNLDGTGAFSNAIPVSATNRSVFFRFMMPLP